MPLTLGLSGHYSEDQYSIKEPSRVVYLALRRCKPSDTGNRRSGNCLLFLFFVFFLLLLLLLFLFLPCQVQHTIGGGGLA